jgi:hypothetical protein
MKAYTKSTSGTDPASVAKNNSNKMMPTSAAVRRRQPKLLRCLDMPSRGATACIAGEVLVANTKVANEGFSPTYENTVESKPVVVAEVQPSKSYQTPASTLPTVIGSVARGEG